jgi:competence protein ComEC
MMIIAWRLNILRTLPVVCFSALLLLSGPLWRAPRTDVWQVHMLDVGQGLAMVIVRNGKRCFTIPVWHGLKAIARNS